MDMDNSVVIAGCRGWVEVGKGRGGIMMGGEKVCKIKRKKEFPYFCLYYLSILACYLLVLFPLKPLAYQS